MALDPQKTSAPATRPAIVLPVFFMLSPCPGEQHAAFLYSATEVDARNFMGYRSLKSLMNLEQKATSYDAANFTGFVVAEWGLPP